MNKIIIGVLSIIIISFSSCKTQQKSNIDKPVSKKVNELKKNQKQGLVIQKSRFVKRGSDKRIFEYFLRTDEKDYYIKFDDGYISKEKLQKYLNKVIIFKGDFKYGTLIEPKPASFINPEPTKVRKGNYVVLYKIYN